MGKQNVAKAQCRQCGQPTTHVILKSRTHKTVEDEVPAWWESTYDMIECCGCQCITLRETQISYDADEPTLRYFPPPGSRRRPDWGIHFLMNADIQLQELLHEVYTALSGDSGRLAAMGCRALLDMAMTDLVGDVGGFEQKLCALETKGLIGIHQRDFLKAALESGHAASHRGHCPELQELNIVMDIVENVLQQIYVLPHAAAELKKSTPARPQKKSSSAT